MEATLRYDSTQSQYYVEMRCTIHDDQEAQERGFRAGEIAVPIPDRVAHSLRGNGPVPLAIDMGRAEFDGLRDTYGEQSDLHDG